MESNLHKLVRAISDGIDTLGVFVIVTPDGEMKFDCETLELPWLNNQHNISRIPAGIYKAVKVACSKMIDYPHIIILNVPSREGIAIHAGNSVHDTRGCVLVGKMDETITEHNYAELIHSRATLQSMLEVLPDEFTLEITDSVASECMSIELAPE